LTLLVTIYHRSQQNPIQHQHLILPTAPYLLDDQPSTEHSIKVTKTRVPLNAMMGPQEYVMFSI